MYISRWMLDQKTIPLFPLSLFLLKGEQFKLHIFEPRYLQLIDELPTESPTFGILYNDPDNNKKFGTVVQLVNVDKDYPEGKKDITVETVGHFKLNKFFKKLVGKLYPAGNVTFIKKNLNKIIRNEKILFHFKDYLKTKLNVKTLSSIAPISYEEMIINHLKLDSSEKYIVFHLDSDALDNFIIEELNYLKLLWRQEHQTQRGVYLNWLRSANSKSRAFLKKDILPDNEIRSNYSAEII